MGISMNSLWIAYGPGSPYFSRTTNMDKWENPILYIGVLFAAGLFLTILLRWFFNRASSD